jgi:carbon starvation protein
VKPALFAVALYDFDPVTGRLILHGLPVMLTVLCVLAIAYRYYSAFLAARVAVLDDTRITPAHQFNDGQNYHPTNKWVLFGHHFAAISGAGPLIGPVLAIQYGYMPGLLWLVVGVCLAGAVQDMLVLAASVRRGGKSLAQIALAELGPTASIITTLAILFIVIIALAGLGFVVVKALGGEDVHLPAGTRIVLPAGVAVPQPDAAGEPGVVRFPPECKISYGEGRDFLTRPEAFNVRLPAGGQWAAHDPTTQTLTLPAGCKQLIAGSSWGTFTIACTIPIALLVGLYMYRIRPGRVVEASLVGAVGVLAATIAGAWVPGSPLEPFFSLSRTGTILALCIYGFIASVLPVWLLLGPRDYLSSFLKIGTIVLMVIGVMLANPSLQAPTWTEAFRAGGPTFPGGIFPFVFICIMCGAISGFHSLVSSGTTPKMVDRESHIRPIGYGAMLIEGLVGVVALIAAASLPADLYIDINVDIEQVARDPILQGKIDAYYREVGLDPADPAARDRMQELAAPSLGHLNVAQAEEMVGEQLRGRTGGAVTLAVGMARILTDAFAWTGFALGGVLKYWYHFAIMFEALFILTTIDAGTRIARFLFQESLGKVYPKFAQTDWLPGAILASLLVTGAWGLLIYTGSISTIWPMFGIANQLLAAMALALVTTMLINHGRARYAPVTLVPMLFVVTTTLTAGSLMVGERFPAMIARGQVLTGVLNISLTLFVMVTVGLLLLLAVSRWLAVLAGWVRRDNTG